MPPTFCCTESTLSAYFPPVCLSIRSPAFSTPALILSGFCLTTFRSQFFACSWKSFIAPSAVSGADRRKIPAYGPAQIQVLLRITHRHAAPVNPPRRKHGFLLREILDHQRENRPVRRRLVPEPPQICLTERPLPRVRLPPDLPRAHPMPNGLLGLRQPQDQPLHVVQARHNAD